MSDTKVYTAIDVLKDHQRQLDPDGIEVGVSRQALDEVIVECNTLRKEVEESSVEGMLQRELNYGAGGAVTNNANTRRDETALLAVETIQQLHQRLEKYQGVEESYKRRYGAFADIELCKALQRLKESDDD